MPDARETDSGLPASLVLVCAMLPAVGMWVLLTFAGFVRAGGLFEYPLDDVYIHLAMAEQIRAGGYGVNAGEYASAASSPIYPFGLALFGGGSLERMMPFLFNLVALIAALLVWSKILVDALRSGIGPTWAVVLLGAVAPVTLNFAGIAFVGMEHTLHLLASLLIIAGLQSLARDNRLSILLVLGITLAPLLRLEGLALAMVGAALVIAAGRRGAGLALVGAAILPAAGFMWWLTSLGLDPLPNSVMAKLGDGAGQRASLFQGFANSFVTNISLMGGKVLLAMSVLALIGASLQNDLRKWIMMGVGMAGFAHLFAGQIGWMDRYEIYALGALVGALALAKRMVFPALLVTGLAGVYYVPEQFDYPDNSRAIFLQQSQMARFAQTFAKTPVAVNDLGRVAWRNPNYVLDLWGLANDEARAIRLGDSPNGWAGRLAQEKGVKLAMIYDKWLEDAVPPNWTRLGTLRMINPAGFLGSDEVAFYVTDPSVLEDMQRAAKLFTSVLPDDAVFEEAAQ